MQLFTRAGNDWTAKFGKQSKALAKLGLDRAWLDGEGGRARSERRAELPALQNAFDANRERDIMLYLFDIPFLNGYDLRGVPLEQRRAILRALLEPVEDDTLRYSEDFGFSADDLLKSACDMALEASSANGATAVTRRAARRRGSSSNAAGARSS